jgi:aminoglycoside phosphotransferase family enzyme
VTPPESAFAQDVRMAQGHPIRVCRAHGDLGIMNMIRVDDQILIFDWEEFCDDAPILTDELMFFLVLNQREFLAKPAIGLRELNQRYLSGANAQRRCDVIMALAFIRASDKPVATKILDNWERKNAQAQ